MDSKILSKELIQKELKKYKESNSEKYGIIDLGFFGSFAKNNQTDSSDIDIVIQIKKTNPFILVHIKEDLENLFQKKIDLIKIRKGMNPFLLKQIELDSIYV